MGTEQNNHKICILRSNPDSRGEKEAITLQKAGYNVKSYPILSDGGLHE